MKILVINTGSSSIKYKLFHLPQEREISSGIVERIGEAGSKISFSMESVNGNIIEDTVEEDFEDHRSGLKKIAEILFRKEYQLLNSPEDIQAVGHRVVHGGETFQEPVIIDNKVVQQIEKLIPLAPLHNPPNLEGIRVAREVFPSASQVAVFDTAFHQSLPPYAYHYAIPSSFHKEHGIRVYGMHGTSHQYVAQQAAKYLKKDVETVNFITIHLGNGCSMTAISNGKSVDTSMGFSPLSGLMMGTRSGDIDPAVVFYMGNQMNMSLEEINQLLNKKSGLKGLTGSNDLRDIIKWQEKGDETASLVLDMYIYRIKKYIGAYYAALGKLDAIVFTAGVGENSPLIREKACQGLEALGIQVDKDKNQQHKSGVAASRIREIQADDSLVKIMVVPTNEELSIAQQTYQVLDK